MRRVGVLLLGMLVIAAWRLTIPVEAGALVHTVMTGEVVKVHPQEHRFVLERPSTGARRYILVDKETKLFHEGRESQAVAFSWRLIKMGALIRAEGGLTLEGKIRAGKIVLLKKKS